ncbi:hypothetical protein DD238_006530 [Peronospora effusa]|uniref:Uncharacterized protein n=1 Tax=Peronospora effusa TaxID=542832 RepID=A0A3M6VIR2_9STRA|nr:hypothetical protein DD238_006530 [Peronospora effusa]RQM10008.1 hypothetical protein DD237_006877 [Peronospora effusa]
MNGKIAVFFDNHIEANHFHIVDVRDVRLGASALRRVVETGRALSNHHGCKLLYSQFEKT